MRRFIALALLALLSAVPALAQEDSPGVSRVSGGVIGTGPVHMGSNLIDGSNILFTGGSFSGLSSIGVTGASTLSGGGTLGGTFAGAHTLSGVVTLSAAGAALLVTNNASLGGTLTTGTGVTNGFLMSGSTLSVTGTGNPAMTIKGLGTGGINFQTGATPFTGLALLDGGASAINLLRVIPGTTGNGVSLQAVGDAAAILNFKAGTAGTAGSAKFFIPVANSGAISQNATFTLAGSNLATLSTLPFSQNIVMAGNNGANSNGVGINSYILTDQAAVNGTLGVATFSHNYTTGADGDRVMLDASFVKNVASLSGSHVFGGMRLFVTISADEGGTGTSFTGSIAANVLTVTAATSPVIAAQTMISGPGVIPTRVQSILTGSGGVGTYSLDFPQDVSSEAMVAGNYKGSAEIINPDIHCNGGSWWSGCQQAEWDIRDFADSQYKDGIGINYALGDAGHGIWSDTAISIGSGDYAPGVGKGRVMISIGSTTHAWPINTADTNSAVLRAQHNIARSFSTNAAQYKATFGVDFTILECGTACWRSPGFTVDGAGQLFAGPLTVAYGSTGATISAPRVTTASATIVSGGGGFVLHEEVLEPQTGSLWDVASVGGAGVVTSLALTKAGFASSCPAGTIRFTSLGAGAALTGTLSCTTSNGIVLAAASDKIGFYGATAIVKATPSGACGGSTGCQAIRNALGNLGLINTGSISD